LRAGRRWNWGRRGSVASLDGEGAARAGARPEEIKAAVVAEVERNLRRLIFMVLHAPLREVGVLSENHTLRRGGEVCWMKRTTSRARARKIRHWGEGIEGREKL
jgi:hypothetical protein